MRRNTLHAIMHCRTIFPVYIYDISKYIAIFIGMMPWKMSLKFQRNFLRRNTGRPGLLLHVRQKLLTLLVENPIFTVNSRHWRDHVKIKNSILNNFYRDLTIAKEIQSIEKEENKRSVPVMKFRKWVLTVTHWVLQIKLKGKTGRNFPWDTIFSSKPFLSTFPKKKRFYSCVFYASTTGLFKTQSTI